MLRTVYRARVCPTRFKTVIGEIDLRTQLQNIAYTVGQRQNGFFRSAFAVGVADSELVPVQAKSGWV